MKERFKNNLFILLNQKIERDIIKELEPQIEIILSNYDIEERKTEIVVYESKIPKSVQIYLVSKKIVGLSDKSLYLYNIVLLDFFHEIRKNSKKIFS